MQTLVAPRAVVGLDVAVLDEVPGPDEVEADAVGNGLLVEREARECGAGVADDSHRDTVDLEQRVDRLDHPPGRVKRRG